MKKKKDSYTIYEAGKRDLYNPFDSEGIDEMIEEEEGDASWHVNLTNLERENEFNPPEKWSPSKKGQRYPFMSKEEYDSHGYPDGAWWVKTLAFKETVSSKYKITQDKTKQYFPLEKLTSETWLKATKSKPKDWVEAWDLSDYDLEISEEEHTNEKGKFNKKSYMNAYESACYAYVNRVVNDWVDEYKHMNFPLTLYRVICVPSYKDIDFKKLGVSWTTREESAQCYDSWKVEKPKESRDFIVKAKVLKTDVDWVGTLAVNINPSFGKDEQEIVLIPGKKIKVLEGGKIKEGIV